MRNFMTADEKVYLKELVQKYKDTLESKKTDCVSVSERKKVWVELSKEFNSLSTNTTRTPEQLKKCWDNIKSRRKKEISQEKKQLMTTGGGPYKPPTENDIDDVLNCVDIELQDVLDNDTVALAQVSRSEYFINENQMLQPVLVNTSNNDEVTVVQNLEIDQEETLQLSAASTSKANKKPEVTLQRNAVTDMLDIDEEENIQSFTPSYKNKRKSHTVGLTRATALERELQVRLQRNDLLKIHEDEIHTLRLQEHQLRIQQEEVKLNQEKVKLEELIIRKKIAEEQLQQEVLKTQALKQKCNTTE